MLDLVMYNDKLTWIFKPKLDFANHRTRVIHDHCCSNYSSHIMGHSFGLWIYICTTAKKKDLATYLSAIAIIILSGAKADMQIKLPESPTYSGHVWLRGQWSPMFHILSVCIPLILHEQSLFLHHELWYPVCVYGSAVVQKPIAGSGINTRGHRYHPELPAFQLWLGT